MKQPAKHVDVEVVDRLIASCDEILSQQLDAIIHHPRFQHLEAAWRGLKFLVDRTDFNANVRIDLLHASKAELRESFEDAVEQTPSALYLHVYARAFDQPGADPYTAILAMYEFENTPEDRALLRNVSLLAARTFCPFLASVGPSFFGMPSWEEWRRIPDLTEHIQGHDYAEWNAFRETEEARFIGLTLPRSVLREPYGAKGAERVGGFPYHERVAGEKDDLWGSTVYLFALYLVEAYVQEGWYEPQVDWSVPAASIMMRRHVTGGLPVRSYETVNGEPVLTSAEVPFGETLEYECSMCGFMPVIEYPGRGYIISSYSLPSTQKPRLYDDPRATAHSRLNARLYYVFLGARFMHYLKVIQRENLGGMQDVSVMEQEFNRWLRGFVMERELRLWLNRQGTTTMTQRTIAQYPLTEASVTVEALEDSPGFFRVKTLLIPYFQREGMDILIAMEGCYGSDGWMQQEQQKEPRHV